ncbi:MAG: hypothetical protein HOD00_03695 [Gemmatimonadales bacterium]|jgi:hypothetical protein|nr:hypothetical protein [Gemmatimonadales bacterium]MBT3773096.1 hypothetical protein [Gemmatimonadales bacterium]MBT3957744.1 hypothetical protein [Gemmatimonadales bacterium]MBT4188629.1 hypothetical protein [Gemmatimonadales bacterium]MBT4436618.1 hypothetical protein [Gemmatimonadales bacterium]
MSTAKQPKAQQATVVEPMDMSTAEVVLKEIKQILDRLGLVFFLRHGTCLGAVRDHAFIEWDDDLDIGSVIGLHGLTEERVRSAADVFEEDGFAVSIGTNELSLAVDLKKSGCQVDWACYRIIDDSIYQWPMTQIPARLHTDLREIEFLGEKFWVPNPPEEYLRLKYGSEWMVPKKAGGFERDVLDLMAKTIFPASFEGLIALSHEFDPRQHTGSLKILDVEGRSIEGAEVSLAATTVLTGLAKAKTNTDGYVYFSLSGQSGYVVGVEYGEHQEILYSEQLAPHVDYVYRPDAQNRAGRVDALMPERV